MKFLVYQIFLIVDKENIRLKNDTYRLIYICQLKNILSFNCVDLTHNSPSMIACLYFLTLVYIMCIGILLSFLRTNFIYDFQGIRKINHSRRFKLIKTIFFLNLIEKLEINVTYLL